MRRHDWARSVLGLIALVALSCGPATVDMMSDAMVDAGGALMDAGRILRDGGEAADGMVGDASAQEPTVVEADCEQSHQHVQTQTVVSSGDTTTTTSTGWSAEVSVAGLSPDTVRSVTVVACDRQTFNPLPPCYPDSAGIDYECTGTPAPAPLRCLAVEAAQIEEGRLRYDCGWRVQVDYSSPTVTDYDAGYRWQTVRFIVEQ